MYQRNLVNYSYFDSCPRSKNIAPLHYILICATRLPHTNLSKSHNIFELLLPHDQDTTLMI